MNWDTLNFRNNKLALTVFAHLGTQVYPVSFSDFKHTENDCTFGTSKYQVYAVSFSDFKRTENDKSRLPD